jgi:hypothetical protein
MEENGEKGLDFYVSLPLFIHQNLSFLSILFYHNFALSIISYKIPKKTMILPYLPNQMEKRFLNHSFLAC